MTTQLEATQSPLEATQALLKVSLIHMDLNGFESLLIGHLRQINSSSAELENANLAFRKAATQMYVEASQGLDLLVGIANELSEDKQAMIRDALHRINYDVDVKIDTLKVGDVIHVNAEIYHLITE